MYALRNKKVAGGGEARVYRYVWSREGRIYAAKPVASGVQRANQPKPDIINRPEDLIKLGWSANEVKNIIHNKTENKTD